MGFPDVSNEGDITYSDLERAVFLSKSGHAESVYAEAAIWPSFSPDGNYVVFVAVGEVRLYDFKKHTLFKTFPIDDLRDCLVWSPDSKKILVSSRKDYESSFNLIEVYDIRTGEIQTVVTNTSHVLWATWSIDGSVIYYSARMPGKEYKVVINQVDMITGKQKTLLQSDMPILYLSVSPNGEWIAFVSESTTIYVYNIKTDQLDFTTRSK